jgi:hypothetical protein
MMAKRQHIFTARCGHESCKECGHYNAATNAEYSDLSKRYGNGKWRCVRHSMPESVLSITNNIRTQDMVNKPVLYDEKLLGLFWDGSSGFLSGPGFRAFAKDFPEGTVLRVTAEVILP